MKSNNHPTGKTRLVGLVGSDISLSLSLAIHNQAFQSLGLNYLYVPLPVNPSHPDRLREAVLGLRALGFIGANVTMPFKEKIIHHLDDLTPAAKRIGAVNTLLIDKNDRLVGGNSDSGGFLADLQANQIEWKSRPVLLLGAGGAARAVAYGLSETGCHSISIFNRTASRAERLAEDIHDLFPNQKVEASQQLEEWSHRPRALIINCTPVGMHSILSPSGHRMLWPMRLKFRPDQVVADLIYAPVKTPLLLKAKSDGAKTINGIGMLIHQAALSFTWWTDKTPPIAHMHAAIQA